MSGRTNKHKTGEPFDIVSRETIIEGIPVGYFRDSVTHTLYENPVYEFHDQKYLLIEEEPHPDQGCYSASAVRIGDPIKDGAVPVHQLKWDIKTAEECGVRVSDHTLIPFTEWGGVLVSTLLEKLQEKNQCPIFINGDGEYVPIESFQISGDEKNIFVRCVKSEDLCFGDSIRIYNLSWANVPDKDIKDYSQLPEVKVEFNGETQEFVNMGEIHDLEICDWDHPSGVDEFVRFVEVDFHMEKRND